MEHLNKPQVQIPVGVEFGFNNIIKEGVTFGKNVKIGSFNIIEKGSHFGDGTIIGNYNDLGENLTTGKNCIIQGRVRTANDCTLEDNVTLKIGVILTSKVLLQKNSFMGPNAITLGSSAYRETFHGTVIGENTYIGAGTKIAANTHVGNNVIIGANSFVNKDLKKADHTVWAGNPIKLIKHVR